MRHEPILAIDPGLRDLGYAVLRGKRLVAGGVVALRVLPKARRLPEARVRLRSLVRQHHPAAIVVEKTYRHPLAWLDALDCLTRSLRRLARKHHLTFATYAPQTVRAAVVGNGRAKKPEVALAVAHRFPQLRVYLTQDRRWKERFWLNLFDAVALALHHQQLPPSRSR